MEVEESVGKRMAWFRVENTVNQEVGQAVERRVLPPLFIFFVQQKEVMQ